MAPRGMVATSQPLAAQAGIEILKSGGNAIDAAIAVNAVLGVVEPMSCGIGGDLFAIVREAESGGLTGLNASGRAPYAATIDYYDGLGHEYIPGTGPLNWSVPGCVDGWSRLLDRFGTMSLGQVLEPAIYYAENGFPVSDIIARDWAGSTPLLKPWPESVRVYLPGGKAPEPGAVFRNPDLARSYRILAEGGRDAYYEGEIAQAVVACSRDVGGLFSPEDFRDHASTWDDPVSVDYRGYTVWELPPSGQGIAALQMLNILEGYDLAETGCLSAETLHLQIEAKKLAYADRAVFYADPAFADVPVEELAVQGLRRPAARTDRSPQGGRRRPGRRTHPAARGHGLHDRRRPGPQRRFVYPEHLPGFRIGYRAGGHGISHPEPGAALLAGSHASQRPGAPQATLPHHHPRHGDPGRAIPGSHSA